MLKFGNYFSAACNKRQLLYVNGGNMSKNVIDKINYFVALITEFASSHHISTMQAYEYLKNYKGLDFVDKYYDVEHTFSFENTVEDLTSYCKRMGGSLA